MGLNELAQIPFSADDMEQFYQLIGYTVDGYGEIFGDRKSAQAADAIAVKLVRSSRKGRSAR